MSLEGLSFAGCKHSRVADDRPDEPVASIGIGCMLALQLLESLDDRIAVHWSNFNPTSGGARSLQTLVAHDCVRHWGLSRGRAALASEFSMH